MKTKPQTTNPDAGKRWTRTAWQSALWALAIGLVLSSGAQTNTATQPAASTDSWPSMESFNVIQRNNIFDPNRRPLIRTGGSTNHPPRVQGFALKGTMAYPKGWFAFFDGTSTEYNKALGVGGVIAGYTLKEITLTNVTLSANGKDFRMPVGRQVRNVNGKWQMGQPVVETNSDETDSEGEATTDSSAVPVAGNAQMQEILQRLMKAKEQELK